LPADLPCGPWKDFDEAHLKFVGWAADPAVGGRAHGLVMQYRSKLDALVSISGVQKKSARTKHGGAWSRRAVHPFRSRSGMPHQPSRKVRGTSASRANANAAGSPPRSRPIASPLPALLPACCHCLAFPAMPHSTSLLTAMPGPRPSAALCAGRREIPLSPRPAWPPSPALCVCLCVGLVWDGVMFLCRSMCFLLSGRLSLAMRLLLRSAVLAVVLHLFSVSVSGAHVVCCSPSRLHIRCAVCCVGSTPTTNYCAYASLGWYTLCSMPGMHLFGCLTLVVRNSTWRMRVF
jgi:hypothetical protein